MTHLAIRQLVALLQPAAAGGGVHVLLKVQRHVRELLLDVAHNLALGRGGERVAALGHDLHHVICKGEE